MSERKDCFWEAQGLKSFVKLKGDWFDYNRVHLSFVQHEGKENNCKQILAIEAGLNIHGNGALYLAENILNGGFEKLAENSRRIAKENGAKYAAAIFSSMGGTKASRSKDGKCTFRQFSIMPGSKADYVMRIFESEGEETSTGGIQKKKDSSVTSISVPVNKSDLIDFARSIQIEWTAYRTRCNLQDATVLPQPQVGTKPLETTKNQNTAARITPNALKGAVVVSIYDNLGLVNEGQPHICRLESAEEFIQQLTLKCLRTPAQLIAIPQTYKDAITLIKEKKLGVKVIEYVGKEDKEQKCKVAVCITEIQ